MIARLLIFGTMLVASASALAAPLSVHVTDAAGKPVKDVVVTVRPNGAGRPMRVGSGYSVSQKDLQFHPFLLVVPVGARVSFPNLDPTKHQVYSFSPAKRFELKLFAKDQSRSIIFDKPGVVALGCNIHDSMTAFIVVTDSAWTAVTDARGTARFADVPNAAASLSIWHPYLRAPGGTVARSLDAGTATAAFSVKLRPPPMHDMSY